MAVLCPPKGPSISSILGGSTLLTSFFCFGGSSSLRLTSAGSDKGAEPIREAHFGVLVKERERGAEKAGIRKSGRGTDGLG